MAADPDAYKKEYGKKLYKLASNVGKGLVPTSSMQLFAKFNSGMITKEELIRQLKAKQAEKEKVDTGEPAQLPSDRDEAMRLIADKYNLDDRAVLDLWKAGLQAEIENGDENENWLQAVFTNLMKEPGYYQS